MTKLLLGATLCFALCIAAVPARADLYSATAAYKKGDFASAFAQFRELAELGQPAAQFDLILDRGSLGVLSEP